MKHKNVLIAQDNCYSVSDETAQYVLHRVMSFFSEQLERNPSTFMDVSPILFLLGISTTGEGDESENG